MEEGNIEIKRDSIVKFLKNNKSYIFLIILAFILIYSSSVRLSNLPLLIDSTTGDYITADPDAALFLRYTEEIVENGDLPEIDNMRYVPIGLPTKEANPIIPHTIASLYYAMHFFDSDITVGLADVVYPVIFFVFGMVAFFFLVAKLFNKKVAILATFTLAILPSYLFRTLAGVGDKEPFGMFFLFFSLLVYIIALYSNSNKKAIFFGILAGISTGLMNLGWNGANFVFLLIGLNSLINIFLDRFSKKDLFTHGSWIISATIMLVVFRFGISGILQIIFFSTTTSLAYFALFVGIFLTALHSKRFDALRNKIETRLPLGVASLFLTFLLGLLATVIFISPTFIFDKIAGIGTSLIHPFGLGRLTLTVAESFQPYFTDWIGNFTWTYLMIFLLGSVFLFYNLVSPLKQFKGLNIKLTLMYVLFLIFFIPTRYSRGARIFNGETTISNLLYIGSLVIFVLIFVIIYLYGFYKDRDLFEKLKTLNKNYVFLFIWLFLMIVAARGAIRLFFVLAPVTAILSSYIIVETLERLYNLKDRIYKYVAIFVILFLLLSPFAFYEGMLIRFAKTTSNSARFTGPAYNPQWQNAMAWVRVNTPEDAVFSHWWDYGYWVQTGGKRATVLDGGNHIAYWDTLMGRHVLTGQTEVEALEFLKTHNSSYLLIDPTDVGKYPAYSSIGSDENLDRLSYIPTFGADPSQIQETRNGTLYIYQGQFPLDEDFIYQDKLFPRNSAGIVAFKVPIVTSGNSFIVLQPTALLAYQNQGVEVPLECIEIQGRQTKYQTQGFKGCLKLIPTINGNNQVNVNTGGFPGAGFYISERSMRALWVQLYLLDKQTPNFELAYNDEGSIPLAVYQGRLIGPLKIWKINYPDDIKFVPEYLNTTGPNFF